MGMYVLPELSFLDYVIFNTFQLDTRMLRVTMPPLTIIGLLLLKIWPLTYEYGQ